VKIWHISDTHTYEDQLTVPEGIDMVIFSGDAGNNRSPYTNEHEVRTFLLWFSSLDIKYKVMIAGNHDSSIEAKLITKRQLDKDYGIIYLEDSSVEIEGLKLWGSPWTPDFGHWSFNRKRDKLHKLWSSIPDDTDIVITHGPPKGILDLSMDRAGNLEFCGCSAFSKRLVELQPVLSLFGHIHNFKGHTNAGVTKLSKNKTIYSNGSVVTDGKFGFLSSNGNIFEIIEKKVKIIEEMLV
jgi:Icc-related predicted phosphoesterase